MRRLRHLAIPLAFWVPRSAIAFQSDLIFRSETHLVQINVIVRDKRGPITNLSKNDFALTDNGRLQEIKAFSVNVAAVAGAKRTVAAPVNTFSNDTKNGVAVESVTVILLDALNTLSSGSEPYEESATWSESEALANAKQHLVRFVAQMQTGDLVAIYSLGHQLNVVSDFTNDREKLLAVLKSYNAVSLTRREDAEPLAVHTPVPGPFNAAVDRERRNFAAALNRDRAEQTMRALRAIAEHLSGIPGRKNLVWFAANLPFGQTAAAMALSRAGVAIYPVDARGLLSAMPARTDDDLLSQRTRRSTVAEGQGPEPTGIGEMRSLAEETGGRAFVNTNDLARAIREAVDDAAVTYTLGFYPVPGSLDGKFHQLKVRVLHHDSFETRYPGKYFAARETATPQQRDRDVLVDALISPLELSAIHLDAHIERLGLPNSGTFEITGHIRSPDLEHNGGTWDGTVDLSLVQQNARGDILAHSDTRYRLQLTNEMYLRSLESGLPFQLSVPMKPETTTLRVVVSNLVDGTGGSLIIPISQVR